MVGFTTSLAFAKKLERIVAWPDMGTCGNPEVVGSPLPDPPRTQGAPQKGTGPRVDVDRTAGQIAGLPHRVLAYRGADGFPVVVPVHFAGHDAAGLRLVEAPRLLPVGGRRAGLLVHAYRPELVGLRTRTSTGWLDVREGGAGTYAPHTSKGFAAPPQKDLLLVGNGLLAKVRLRRAVRRGVPESLQQLARDRTV